MERGHRIQQSRHPWVPWVGCMASNSQITYLLCKPLVQFLLRVEHQTFSLGTFLALRHQRRHLITLKQTGYFTVGKQRVHPLQETGVEHVRLVHDETDSFTLHNINSSSSSGVNSNVSTKQAEEQKIDTGKVVPNNPNHNHKVGWLGFNGTFNTE